MKTNKQISIIISCSTKFHAFALAEQMEKQGQLKTFYTTFASFKNTFFRKFVSRLDKEQIDAKNIKTNIPIAILLKFFPSVPQYWNEIFDRWVAWKIKSNPDFDVFIGWSGMSLHSIRQAKKMGKITIVERGSSHILYQDAILKEEYLKFGKVFSINKRVIVKELKEYQEANYISIPSSFVKKSFIEMGVFESKLLVNQYGVNLENFEMDKIILSQSNGFKLLYLGNLSFRKGIPYLFEALKSLNNNCQNIEIHFIGSISEDFIEYCNSNKETDWIFHGHIPNHKLKDILLEFDLAIHPALEEGLSLVLAQLLASAIPVIATTNTGGMEFIQDGHNGFIVPIRNSGVIKDKIEYLYKNKDLLEKMKINAVESVKNGFTWNDYGKRWKENLEKIV